MTSTNVNLAKFTGLDAYAKVPVAHVDGRAYLDSVSAVAAALRSRMSDKGVGFADLAAEAGVPEDSLSRLLDTGVTGVRDALSVFRCLGLRVTAIPPEYAGTVS